MFLGRFDSHSDRPMMEYLVLQEFPYILTHILIDYLFVSFLGLVGYPETSGSEVFLIDTCDPRRA